MTTRPASVPTTGASTFVTVPTPSSAIALKRSQLMELMFENLAREQAIAREREVLHAAQNRRLIAALRAQRRNEGAAMRVRRLLALAAIR